MREQLWDLLGGLFSVLGLLCVAFFVGFSAGVESSQKRCIEHGVGHWTVNSTNGVRTFVYGNGGAQ